MNYVKFRHYAAAGKGNGLLYVIMLCDRGINVNAQNKDGDTCLNLCVKNGAKDNLRIIQKLLFDFKANPYLKNIKNDDFFTLMAKESEKKNVNLNEVVLSEELKKGFLEPIVENEKSDNCDKIIEKGIWFKNNYFLYYILCAFIAIISNRILK